MNHKPAPLAERRKFSAPGKSRRQLPAAIDVDPCPRKRFKDDCSGGGGDDGGETEPARIVTEPDPFPSPTYDGAASRFHFGNDSKKAAQNGDGKKDAVRKFGVDGDDQRRPILARESSVAAATRLFPLLDERRPDNDEDDDNDDDACNADDAGNKKRRRCRNPFSWWSSLTLMGRLQLLLTIATTAFFYFDIFTDVVLAIEYRHDHPELYDGRCVMTLDQNRSIKLVYPDEDLSTTPSLLYFFPFRSTTPDPLPPSTPLSLGPPPEPLLDATTFFRLTTLFMILPLFVRGLELSSKETLWHYVFHGFRPLVDATRALPWRCLRVVEEDTWRGYVMGFACKVIVVPLLPILIPLTMLRKFRIEYRLIRIQDSAEASEEEDEEGAGSVSRATSWSLSALRTRLVSVINPPGFADAGRDEIVQDILVEVLKDPRLPESRESRLSDELLKISEHQFCEAFFEDAPQFILQLVWTILDGSDVNFLRGVVTLSSIVGLCLRVWSYRRDVVRKNPIRREPTLLGDVVVFLVRLPAMLARLLFLAVLFGSVDRKWREVGAIAVALHLALGAAFDVWHLEWRVEKTSKMETSEDSKAESGGDPKDDLRFAKPQPPVNELERRVGLIFKILKRGVIANVTLLEHRLHAYDSRTRAWKDEGGVERMKEDPGHRFWDQIIYYGISILAQGSVAFLWYLDDHPSCIFDVNVRHGGSRYRRELALILVVVGPALSATLNLIHHSYRRHPSLSRFGAKALLGLGFFLKTRFSEGNSDGVCGLLFQLGEDEKKRLRRIKDETGDRLESRLRDSKMSNQEKSLIKFAFCRNDLDGFLQEALRNLSSLPDSSARLRLLESLSYFWDKTSSDVEESFLFRCVRETRVDVRQLRRRAAPFAFFKCPVDDFDDAGDVEAAEDEERRRGTTPGEAHLIFTSPSPSSSSSSSSSSPSPYIVYEWRGRDRHFLPASAVRAFDSTSRHFRCQHSSGDVPLRTVGAAGDVVGAELVVFGGVDPGGAEINDAHSLDLRDLVWRRLTFDGATDADMPAPRHSHAAWGWDGALYAFGGAGRRWERFLTTNGRHEFGDDGVGFNDQLLRLRMSGDRPVSAETTPVSAETTPVSAERTPVSGSTSVRRWESVPTVGQRPTPRAFAASCVTPLGDAFVFGGRDVTGKSADLFRLNIPASTWTRVEILAGPEMALMTTTMTGTVTSLGDGNILLCGGDAESGRKKPECHVINVSTSTVHATIDLPSLKRSSKWILQKAVGSPHIGRVFLVGGERGRRRHDFMLELDLRQFLV